MLFRNNLSKQENIILKCSTLKAMFSSGECLSELFNFSTSGKAFLKYSISAKLGNVFLKYSIFHTREKLLKIIQSLYTREELPWVIESSTPGKCFLEIFNLSHSGKTFLNYSISLHPWRAFLKYPNSSHPGKVFLKYSPHQGRKTFLISPNRELLITWKINVWRETHRRRRQKFFICGFWSWIRTSCQNFQKLQHDGPWGDSPVRPWNANFY